MPLTADDFVQENSGSVDASTAITVTLPSGTTAGNTLVVTIRAGGTVTAPSGFTTDLSYGGIWTYHKSDLAASETSWAFTQSLAVGAAWYVAEMTNVDSVEPLDATATGTNGALSNGGTLATGTTPLNAGLSSVAFGVFGASRPDGITQSWAGYTNGFEECAEVASAAVPASHLGQHIGVARNFLDGTTGTYQSTATFTTTDPGTAAAFAQMVVYRAADAPIAAPLDRIAGFEWGTHGGMGTGGTVSLMGGLLGASGTFGTSYLIQAGSARNGGYGLRLVASAGTTYVLMGNVSWSAASFGFNVRVVSATGTPVVAEVWTSSGSGISLQLVYDAATTKFGLKWSTGSTAWESGTTALNTWRWIDFRLRTNSTTWHADWRIETGTDTYTDQTSPADLTGQSATVKTNALRLSDDASQTVTMDVDDVIMSRFYVAYPLGPHKVTLLTVDTGGTPTVSGTTTNFNVFTANGTLAAWNATNARDALDEVPPTVSASADGVVQNAVAASDYMEFPMATYTCTAQEIIAAVRMLASAWGGTGTGTGTLGIRGYDGTTETTLIAASTSYDAASPTAIAAAAPVWQCAMWPSGVGWTQAELNAAALRVGFSTDATPDMGVSAIYLEVATRPALTYRQIRAGDAEEFTADIRLNPYNSASISYLIESTDATRGATFSYSISGTPQTPVYCAASTTEEVVVNATDFGEISDVSLEPDA